MAKKGSRFWSNSYIVLENGEVIYLENSLNDLQKKMNSIDEEMELRIARNNNVIYIKPKYVRYYGKE